MINDTAALLSLHHPTIQPMRLAEVVAQWKDIETILGPAVDSSPDRGDTFAAVMQDITTGAAVLHTIDIGVKRRAVFVTYVKQRKDGMALHVWQLGGDGMDAWLKPFLDYLTNWASIWGCELVTFGGRKGWQKALARHGYKTESVQMSLRVEL